jgi:hypothetical protein
LSCLALVLALALAACAPPGRPLVAEVVYDATGDDTGKEFVELHNPSGAPYPLAGLRLEAGDGSAPGRWTLRWTGGALDTVPPRGRFVVGGAGVQPAPQAVATLDLQNGPDAVRLVWPDGATEVVGWGAHEHAEYACGEPAIDVAAGQSLARVPDASDRGANALDFRAAIPSPGRPNQSERDLAVVTGSLALSPEQPEPHGSARLAGAVANPGTATVSAAEAELRLTARDASGATAATSQPLAALGPGDTLGFAVEMPPLPAGRWTVVARVALAGDQAEANDADSLAARVGPGPLELTEIQFHPADGEGEWVELRNRSGAPVDLTGYTLSDRGTGRARLTGSGALAPESLAVIAQSRAALLARHPSVDPGRVWEAAPWPALNNSDDSTGRADAVVLREADGARCERVDYSSAGVPPGVPIERREGSWWPALSSAGTPLEPPRAPPPLASRLEVVPRRWRAGATAVRLAWSLPWPRARVSIEVYDLAGRRIARALDSAAVPGRGHADWDAAALPPGLYLLALRASDGAAALTEARAVRVTGAEP